MSVQSWKWAHWGVCAAHSSEQWCFPLPCLAAAVWVFQQHLKYSIKNTPKTLANKYYSSLWVLRARINGTVTGRDISPPWLMQGWRQVQVYFHFFPSTMSIFWGKDRMARGIMDFWNLLSLHPTISCSAEVYLHSRHWFHCMNLSGGLINVMFSLLYLFLSLALGCWCSWLTALVFERV